MNQLLVLVVAAESGAAVQVDMDVLNTALDSMPLDLMEFPCPALLLENHGRSFL